MTLTALSRATCAAWLLIGDERLRQVTVEGWSAEHDDGHDQGELLLAARCYMHHRRPNAPVRKESWRSPTPSGEEKRLDYVVPAMWPWSPEWWKPTTRDRDLVKAGALAWAEISRMERKGERDHSESARPFSAGPDAGEAIELLDGIVDALAACLIDAALLEAGR